MNRVLSTNVSWDCVGQQDARPSTWGTTGVNDVPIKFVDVPNGYRARIDRITGDLIAWAHAADGSPAPPSSSFFGALTGILVAGSGQDPDVGPGLASSGCPFYVQGAANAYHAVNRVFDFDVSAGGLLGEDNTFTLRQAVFLNDTGLPIHVETTLVIQYDFEPVEANQ